MKAAVCREFNTPLVIEEVELADPGAGEIQVKTAACAICHSDIHYAEGAWGGDLPAVFGHEAAGTVEAVGPGVRDVTVGDHIVVTLIRSCGSCHYCSRGAPAVCDTRFPLDEVSPLKNAAGETYVQGLRTGGFADRMIVDQSQVVVVPKDLPFDTASLLACGVITGFGAVVNTAGMEPGSNIVVIGTGGVGLNAVQGAALSGANRVIAVDVSEDKLEAARSFGATDTVDAMANDASQQIKSITAGRKADYVFVTVGAKTAIEQAFRFLARRGTVVLVGIPEGGVKAEFDPGMMAAIEQKIVGSKMGSSRIQVDIPMLVDLYSQKRLKLDELITGRYPLDQINKAIRNVKDGKALRNVIVF